MKTLSYSIILNFVFLFVITAAHGQTVARGMFMAGGNAGFNVVRSGGDSDAFFQLNPSLGAFIVDDLAVGGNLNVTLSDNVTQFGFGPFVRYYFIPNAFAQGGFGFNATKIRRFDTDGSLYANLGIGYSIFLNRAVALEPIMSFNFGENQDVFGVNIGFQVFIGK
jgi:hypothetical protein